MHKDKEMAELVMHTTASSNPMMLTTIKDFAEFGKKPASQPTPNPSIKSPLSLTLPLFHSSASLPKIQGKLKPLRMPIHGPLWCRV